MRGIFRNFLTVVYSPREYPDLKNSTRFYNSDIGGIISELEKYKSIVRDINIHSEKLWTSKEIRESNT